MPNIFRNYSFVPAPLNSPTFWATVGVFSS